MQRANAYLAGIGLVFGAAIAYALGVVLADASTAPIVAAAGAGVGSWSVLRAPRCGEESPGDLVPTESTLRRNCL